jgi:glycosyltransferase involved in cell wall biosynthesis
MEKILTICIPTYNRPSTLEKLLDGLLGQDLSRATILIADDSTNNQVYKLLNTKYACSSNIKYVKNPKNLGFNSNIANLYKLSTTKYIWYLCDDETIFKDSISNIINVIDLYSPSIAIMNCEWRDSFGRVRAAYGNKSDCLTIELGDDFTRAISRLTFLSICVFQKMIDIDSLTRTKNFGDNVFAQVSLGLMISNERIKIIESNLIICFRNVGYKYGNFYKFSLIDFPKSIDNIYTHKYLPLFSRIIFLNLWHSLLLIPAVKIGLFKYDFYLNKKIFNELVKYYKYRSYIFILIIFLIKLIPKIIYKIIYLIIVYYQNLDIKSTISIYRNNINRSIIDERDTNFTNYK